MFSEASSVALLDDGRFIVGGSHGTMFTVTSPVATCFLEDGSIDAGCGVSGSIFPPGGSSVATVNDLFRIEDGRLLVSVAWSSLGSAKTSGYAVSRMSLAGEVDAAFGDAGVARASIGGGSLADTELTAEGRLRLATVSWAVGLNPDGQPDATWGNKPFYSIATESLVDLALLPDGGLVGVGTSGPNTATDGLVTVFSRTGVISARVGVDLGAGDDQAMAVAVQPDGRIVIAGISGGRIFVARLTGQPIAYLTLPSVLSGHVGTAPARVLCRKNREDAKVTTANAQRAQSIRGVVFQGPPSVSFAAFGVVRACRYSAGQGPV